MIGIEYSYDTFFLHVIDKLILRNNTGDHSYHFRNIGPDRQTTDGRTSPLFFIFIKIVEKNALPALNWGDSRSHAGRSPAGAALAECSGVRIFRYARLRSASCWFRPAADFSTSDVSLTARPFKWTLLQSLIDADFRHWFRNVAMSEKPLIPGNLVEARDPELLTFLDEANEDCRIE